MTEPLQVNPLVGVAPAEEMVTPEVDETVPAPLAEEPPEPIERRSRRAGKQAPEQPKPVDLTQFEEYRKVQAEHDRKLAEVQREAEAARQRAADLQRQMEERAQKEAFDRLQYLQDRVTDDTLEADERKAALQEYQYLSGQTYNAQMQRWEQFKRSEITKAGLDPTDPRFQRAYSPGQAGLAEFQADLATAEAAKYKVELEQARKAVPTPENLADLVRQEIAKLAKAQGLDQVDLAEPAAQTSDDDAWERDAAAMNNGRMSPAEFTRKWGKPLR